MPQVKTYHHVTSDVGGDKGTGDEIFYAYNENTNPSDLYGTLEDYFSIQPDVKRLAMLRYLARNTAGDGQTQAADLLNTAAANAAFRNQFTVPVYVADRTALKTLDGTKDLYAYLAEAGRQGIFKADRSGTLAAKVTADSQEGIYIEGTDGTVWVRDTSLTFGEWYWSWFGITATGTAGADQAAAINAWMAIANIDKPGMTSMGTGVFPLDSRITTATHPLGLRGERAGTQQTVLWKRFAEADTYLGVLSTSDWGFNLKDFCIRANPSTASGGSGFSAILATNQSGPVNQPMADNINISGGDGFNYARVIDGSANTQVAGPCYRDVFWTRSECFSGALGTDYIKSTFNFTSIGCNAKGVGGTSTQALKLTGASNAINTHFRWDGQISGTLDIDYVDQAVFTAPTSTGITIGANCEQVQMFIPEIGGNIVFTAGATNCVIYGHQSSGTITGAGVNGCRVIDPTSNDWEVIAEDTPSAAASLEYSGLSAYREIKVEGFLKPATDAQSLFLRVGATTVDSGASDYSYQHGRASGSTASAVGSTATSSIAISGTTVGSDIGEGISFEFTIHEFNSAVYAYVDGRSMMVSDAGAQFISSFGGRRLAATARDIFRLFFGSGNIASGHVIVKGLRG